MSANSNARDHALSFHWYQGREDIPEDVAQQLDLETLAEAIDELLAETPDPGEEPFETCSVGDDEFASWMPPPGLVDLALSLRSAVLGQDAAIGAVAERVAMSLAGLKLRPERPHGVILLNGPTGVGKSTLARQLASAAYHDPSAVIRLDMSEYADASDARMKLIGASKIWRNSTRDGLLTTRVIQHPRSVVVLDEFEKAHPGIWPLFLQVFDEGRLTDGWGTQACFAETIIVMTTNLGTGPDARSPEDVFPKELLGRVDVNLELAPLTPGTVSQIVTKEVREMVTKLAEQGWRLDVQDEVTGWIANHQVDTGLGVRGLQHTIERLLLAPLAAFEERNVQVRVRPDGEALMFQQPAGDAEASR